MVNSIGGNGSVYQGEGLVVPKVKKSVSFSDVIKTTNMDTIDRGILSKLGKPSHESAENLIKVGEEHLKNKHYASAVSAFDEVLASDTRNLVAMRGRGLANYKLNNLGASLEDFTRYLKKKPKDAEILGKRGAILYKQDKLKPALNDLNKALSLNPSDMLALARRGDIYCSLSNYVAALNDFDIVLQNDPGNAFILERRGMAHAVLHHWKLALSDFERVKDLSAEMLGLVEQVRVVAKHEAFDKSRNSSLLYSQKGNYPLALEVINEIIDKDTDNRLHNLKIRSDIYTQMYNYDCALIDLREAVQLDPDDASLAANLSAHLFAKGEEKEASTYLATALALDQENPQALYLRGQQKYLLGNFDAAFADIEKSLAKDPKNSLALRIRGDIYRVRKDYRRALNDLEESERISAYNPPLIYEKIKDLRKQLGLI